MQYGGSTEDVAHCGLQKSIVLKCFTCFFSGGLLGMMTTYSKVETYIKTVWKVLRKRDDI
jgi:hypothetical protein